MSALINVPLHGMNGGLVILRDIVVPGRSGGDAASGDGLTGGRCSSRLRIVSKDADELLELGD